MSINNRTLAFAGTVCFAGSLLCLWITGCAEDRQKWSIEERDRSAPATVTQLLSDQGEPTRPYVDRDLGFSIQFPVNWTVKEAVADDSIVIKATRRGRDHHFAALNIHVWEMEDPNAFSELTPRDLFQQSYADQATLLDSGAESIGERNAIWLEMSFPSNSARAVGYAILRRNQLFWLYGTTVLGGDEWYRENRDELLRAIRSFRFVSGRGQVPLAQLGSTNGSSTEAPSGEAYYDKAHQFSITFPDGWTVKRSSSRDTVIKAVVRDARDRLAQITIAAYQLPDDVTATDANELTADIMWQGLKEQFPDFSVKRHSFGEIKIRSRRAVWNTIEIDAPPQAAMFAKHFHFIEGRYLYRVTAMTDHDRSFFDSIIPTMESSVGTLAFGL